MQVLPLDKIRSLMSYGIQSPNDLFNLFDTEFFPTAVYWKTIDSKYLNLNLYATQYNLLDKLAINFNKSGLIHKSDYELFDEPIADAFREQDEIVLAKPHSILSFQKTLSLDPTNIIHNVSIKRTFINEQRKAMGIFGFTVNIRHACPELTLDKILQIHTKVVLQKLLLNLLSSKNNDTNTLFEITHLFLCLPGFYQHEIINQFSKLTKRELECVLLSLKNYPAKYIAKALNISNRTVEDYLQSVKTKFSLSSKSDINQWFWHFLSII
ncbi:MAG: hypothetical protein Tsb005_02250 [Gammaproteobacteria bacterium]